MENKIEKVTFVDVGELWSSESRFTAYLKENIDILSEELDLELSNPRREEGTGFGMRVDLLADLGEVEEDEDEPSKVVIENQFNKSNHDHLGKLIAYLASFEADIAVWVVEQAKPEHIDAVNWLNETSEADFYLVRLEVIKIGDSPYAPLLTLIAEPSERKVQSVGKNLDSGSSKRIEICRQWWQNLWNLPEHKDYTYSFNDSFYHRDPKYSTARTRKHGLRFSYVVKNEAFRIELALGGTGNDMKKEYQVLEAKKQEIESAFGEPLEWMDIREGSKTGRRRILYSREGVGGDSPQSEWTQAQREIIEKAKKLQEVLRPYIDNF